MVADENSLDTSVWSSLNETNLQGGGVALLPNGLPKEGFGKTLLQGREIQFQDLREILFFKEQMIYLT